MKILVLFLMLFTGTTSFAGDIFDGIWQSPFNCANCKVKIENGIFTRFDWDDQPSSTVILEPSKSEKSFGVHQYSALALENVICHYRMLTPNFIIENTDAVVCPHALIRQGYNVNSHPNLVSLRTMANTTWKSSSDDYFFQLKVNNENHGIFIRTQRNRSWYSGVINDDLTLPVEIVSVVGTEFIGLMSDGKVKCSFRFPNHLPSKGNTLQYLDGFTLTGGECPLDFTLDSRAPQKVPNLPSIYWR